MRILENMFIGFAVYHIKRRPNQRSPRPSGIFLRQMRNQEDLMLGMLDNG